MEDDLRKEYDLKSLKVRKLGSARKNFGKYQTANNIENEIDILINILEQPFVSKRSKFQEKIIRAKKNINLKKYRRYFLIGAFVFWILFLASLKLVVILSKRNDAHNFQIIGVILIFATLFFLLAAMIFLLLYEFSDLLDFRTYQDELHSIKKAIKENIQKLGLHDKKQTVVESRKIGINFLKSQFEHRIKNIENRLKFVDSVAYIYAILWLLSSFLIIGLPKGSIPLIPLLSL
jgi:hypothetical protein